MARPLIVFDLDGTLVDSLPDIAAAMNLLLRDLALPERPLDDFRRIAGDGARVAVERGVGERLTDQPEALDDLTARYLDFYRSLPEPAAAAYDGVPEMLASLAASEPRPALGVLTNKPHDIAQTLVASAFPGVAFHAVEGVRAGRARKPDPGGLRAIMEQAGAAQERTLYVGDTDTDMKTGRAAGVFTIGCAWGFRDEDELRAHDADAIAHHPDDIVKIASSRFAAARVD